jgi:catechol 2,3-dioxygenase-like lactoylglutathione lyase family enzyme
MDNVGIVVDDLAATIDFFRELGLLEGTATVEGEWAGRVTGLGDQRVEIAMMRTPDGHGRLELSRFLTRRVGLRPDDHARPGPWRQRGNWISSR